MHYEKENRRTSIKKKGGSKRGTISYLGTKFMLRITPLSAKSMTFMYPCTQLSAVGGLARLIVVQFEILLYRSALIMFHSDSIHIFKKVSRTFLYSVLHYLSCLNRNNVRRSYKLRTANLNIDSVPATQPTSCYTFSLLQRLFLVRKI